MKIILPPPLPVLMFLISHLYQTAPWSVLPHFALSFLMPGITMHEAAIAIQSYYRCHTILYCMFDLCHENNSEVVYGNLLIRHKLLQILSDFQILDFEINIFLNTNYTLARKVTLSWAYAQSQRSPSVLRGHVQRCAWFCAENHT